MDTTPLEGTTGKPKEAFIPFPSALRTGEPIQVVVQANLNSRDTGCDEVTNRLEHFVSILPESRFIVKHESLRTAELSRFPNLFVDQNNQVKATACRQSRGFTKSMEAGAGLADQGYSKRAF